MLGTLKPCSESQSPLMNLSGSEWEQACVHRAPTGTNAQLTPFLLLGMGECVLECAIADDCAIRTSKSENALRFCSKHLESVLKISVVKTPATAKSHVRSGGAPLIWRRTNSILPGTLS